MKKVNYRHCICIGITLWFLFLAIFHFRYADNRILESIIDLKNSSLFWVSNLLDLDLHGKISINEFSSCPFELPFGLPNNWTDFKVLWCDYWKAWTSLENFLKYINSLANFLYYVSKILLVVLPVLLILVLVKLFVKKDIDNKYNVDSKPLKMFKKLERKVYRPVKHWIIQFVEFVRSYPLYYKIWLLIWLYNFNIISIGIETLAYYLYFVCSFKTITIYVQLVKLLMDLSVMINFIPLLIWIWIGIFVFCKITKKIGYDRLNHFELRDRGFINERPIVLMLCGTMGSKKTTMITDIALSQEIMFRDEAFERLLKMDLKFPNFPWINLEMSLKRAMDNHSVYNLATCKQFVNSKRKKFQKHPQKRYIFMYDFDTYGIEYYDTLSSCNIWEAIETYVQLFFIYVVESTLLISNYSIRTDNVLTSVGNFPLWENDLFQKDAKLQETYSRYAHILDFDMLRLGKKMLDFNEKENCFEFGVINITEIGKERQNAIELKEIKKNASEANQKNDLFNAWLKLVRHSATVDNFPFVKIITDDQRAESWGADARELCEIIYIDNCSKPLNVRPFFYPFEVLVGFLIHKFKKRYYDYRFNHGSNSLFMYLYKRAISKLNTLLIHNINTFGYYELDTVVESGRQDGKVKESKYYLMFKKVYSKRFSTDCFSDFFNEKALRSALGIADLEEFKTIKASFEELVKENSYFFNDLIQLKEEYFDIELSKRK